MKMFGILPHKRLIFLLKMNSISVVIITLNEELTIARCIKSVIPVADEIIVVDSHSRDRTKEICRNLGVQFYEHPFEGYIQQQAYATSLANFEYIFTIDADEALDKTLCNSILEAKKKLDCDAYSMNRMNNYCGKWIRHGSWYPDRKIRLWNRNKGRWGGRNPHNTVKMDHDSKIGYLNGELLHYCYDSVEAHINQFNQFTSISARELFLEKRKVGIFGIFVKSMANFVQGFFFKLGFLDGYYGITICFINSFATFMKYVKLRELNKNGSV